MFSSAAKSKHLCDFRTERILNTGKSNIMLVRSLHDQKNYVLKIYPKDKPSCQSFNREKHIHSLLSHQNIIQFISNAVFSFDGISYQTILIEYAPFGDFFNFSLNYDLKDEKLIRTFFHQLIEGLEYLHSNNIAHLDLKLENLLLGEDFMLKIADFDLAVKVGSETLSFSIVQGGTANYRCPEILSGTCKNYLAADVYSAGICLYNLMAGAFPFLEEKEGKSISLYRYDTFLKNPEEFWTENELLIGANNDSNYFSSSLRELLNGMWAKNPSDRATLEDIKKSKWYNEPIYSKDELKNKIEQIKRIS